MHNYAIIYTILAFVDWDWMPSNGDDACLPFRWHIYTFNHIIFVLGHRSYTNVPTPTMSTTHLTSFGVTSWLLGVCVLSAAAWYAWCKHVRSKFPPGPPSLPIVGSLPFFKSTDLIEVLSDFQKTYGDVFTLDMGSNRTVVLNSYDVIKEALVKVGSVVRREASSLGLYFRINKGMMHVQ